MLEDLWKLITKLVFRKYYRYKQCRKLNLTWKKKKKENPYKGCVLFNAEVYGPFKRWGKDSMFKVADLNADISTHFKALRVYDSNSYINLKCLGHQSLVS